MNLDRKMSPTALSPADAARVLSASGNGAVNQRVIEGDIERGAPANPDGTINLVHYAAWLVKELAARGD